LFKDLQGADYGSMQLLASLGHSVPGTPGTYVEERTDTTDVA
jgi:hypothetical protein